MSTFEQLSYSLSLAAAAFLTGSPRLLAQGSTTTGNFAGPIPTIGGASNTGNIRQIILSVLTYVLNFLALFAIIFIVVAGFRLIVSQGEEEQKEKAKKTILYVVLGLIAVLFARVIVGFFTEEATNIIG